MALMDTDPATISTSEATYGSERDGETEERAVNRRDRRPCRRADPRTPASAGPIRDGSLVSAICQRYDELSRCWYRGTRTFSRCFESTIGFRWSFKMNIDQTKGTWKQFVG